MKDATIEFRCTEEEKEEIKESAKKANLNMSQYISVTLRQSKGIIDREIIAIELTDIIKKIESGRTDIDLQLLKERIKQLW